jgi:hypothetical protein
VQKHGDSPMVEVLLGASARIPAQSMCALCGPANDGGTDGVVDLLREHVPVLHCEVGGMLPANHKVVYVPQVRVATHRSRGCTMALGQHGTNAPSLRARA